MVDYIDRSDAKRLLLDYGDSFGANLLDRVKKVRSEVVNRTGEWILAPAIGGNYNFAFGCSVCGMAPDIGSITSEFKYCPWCGADMRGENNV